MFRGGELVDEPVDARDVWRDDLVAFLIGCSFTFESALLQSGVPVRHIEEQRIVPMFRTNLACRPAGIFRGPRAAARQCCAPDGHPHWQAPAIHNEAPAGETAMTDSGLVNKAPAER